MPTIPLFANASISMSAGPMHGFNGTATVSFQAGPAHMGFYGSAQIVLFTGSQTLPATGRAELGFVTFNLIPAPARAELETAKVRAWMAFPISPDPAAAALDIRGGADCDTPYGCLEVGPPGSAPELELPCFLQGSAAASLDTGSTAPARPPLGTAKSLFSDRPPSCRLSFATSGAALDAGQGLAGGAQLSVQAFDRSTRPGDLSGLIVPEIRMEAGPVSIRCSTRVCVSDFKVARLLPGDEGESIIPIDGPLNPYNPLSGTA
jgi:hypothetical protein